MITHREIAILGALARYYLLTSRQIQRLLFPDDASGRVTRRRLQMLVNEKLVHKQQMLFAHPHSGSLGPVYYSTSKGLQLLVAHFDDEQFLKTSTRPPIPHHVWHWLAITETHIALDAAIEKQNLVKLCGWINEHDELDGDAVAPEKKFRLYTLIRESPRLVNAPDAAFLLKMGPHSKIFYLEQDRATSGTQQIAASKAPGYAALAEQGLHRRHFPAATVESFTVLMITPGVNRRNALRKALRDKPGAHLWRFATTEDVTADSFLHDKIWYATDDSPAGSLVKGESS